MKRILLLLLLSPLVSRSQNPAIGQWRDHLSYSQIFAVEASKNHVFGAASQGIIEVNLQDNSVSKLSRINGLNDFSITAIKYDPTRNMLITGYQNGNIDLLGEDEVYNIPDIKRANVVGDKTIYNINVSGDLAYLACGFGIVVYDLKRLEIKDTYKFGPNGSLITVYDLLLENGKIYAATGIGLYSADLSNNFLSNFENWTRDNSLSNPTGSYTEIESLNNRIYLNYRPASGNDVVYENTGSGWNQKAGIAQTRYSSIKANGNKLAFTAPNAVYIYDENGQAINSINGPAGNGFTPNDCVFHSNSYWIADEKMGLLKSADGSIYDNYTPNGPQTNSIFKLFAESGYVYIATGAVNQIYNNGNQKDGIPYFNGSMWSTPDENSDDSLRFAEDFLGVAIDPKDPSHSFIGSWNVGLIEMRNGKVVRVYNEFNSAIQEVVGFSGTYRVATSAFDPNGNLWIGNSNCANNLVVKRTNGEWLSFKMGPDFGSATSTIISQVLVTQDGTKWMIRHRGGLYAYNENNTFGSAADDQYRGLNNEPNNGGLPSNLVLCMAEDLDGELWLGTDKGFAILYSPGAVFQGGNINASQPIIEQDGNYEKILETEVINSIAVDGGNRKWMATESSGVYLLSEDGTKQIQHFTTENSPLLSDEVFSVTIDQLSGEVFFGTSLGVQSYLSDATGSTSGMSTISVYPNPVLPEYDGPIALRGMVRDANVKITDISGNLVYETRSEGGQAIWNGKNFRGEKSATGVYLVFTTNSDGSETAAGKIIFVK